MSETELSDLIAGIYDAALDRALWPRVLAEIAGFLGGQAAAVLAKSSVTKDVTSFYYTGVSAAYMQAYLDLYWRYDTFGVVEAMGFPVGEAITTVDLVPYDEFREGRFYREWAEPQGWVDSVWVVLDRSATSFGFFSVLRNRQSGMVDDGVRRRMALVAPHLRRSVLIGNILDVSRTEAETVSAAVDHLRAAVFFVDGFGRICRANAAGHAMLAAGDPFRSVAGRLTTPDDRAGALLREAFVNAAAGDVALGAGGVAVPLEGRERHVAHVLPLASGARRRAQSGAAMAAVFVQPQALARPAAPEIIARAYRLTPTELRVLLAVVDVGGVPEVAEALGIAETTVRTHLARVYGKTELNRQADLVKLVAGFSSPVG